ncbi:MAG: hypothetical protein HKN17_04440, partial [Rhodothermales bacterium]|nr:hypothetical protein [Rhodothermales bacterium]
MSINTFVPRPFLRILCRYGVLSLFLFGTQTLKIQAQDIPDRPVPTDPLPRVVGPAQWDLRMVGEPRAGRTVMPVGLDLVLVTPRERDEFVFVDPDGQIGKQPAGSVVGSEIADQNPVAIPDVYTTPEGVALTVAALGHLGNDYDPNGDPITWISYTLPVNGTISGAASNGAFT